MTKKFREDLLLDLWREAGKHLDLGESLPVLGKALFGALPASALVIEVAALDGGAGEIAEWTPAGGVRRQHRDAGDVAPAAWGTGGLAVYDPAGGWKPALAALRQVRPAQPALA